jgi:hypothetical protein
VLTDLQSLLDCQLNFSLFPPPTHANRFVIGIAVTNKDCRTLVNYVRFYTKSDNPKMWGVKTRMWGVKTRKIYLSCHHGRKRKPATDVVLESFLGLAGRWPVSFSPHANGFEIGPAVINNNK